MKKLIKHICSSPRQEASNAMSTYPTPNFPKSKIPPWERRRRPERWRWNGNRKGDPCLPRLAPTTETSPGRILLWAVLGSIIGCLVLFLAIH